MRAREDAEARLAGRLPEVRLSRILDRLLEGFQIIDRNWRYLWVNRAAARHGRRSREDLVGERMEDVYPGIEETEVFRVLRRCMEEREPVRLENEFVYPDGDRSWFELSVYPIPEGIVVLSLDIDDLKDTQAKLHRLNRELEERIARRTRQLEAVNEELEAFTYSVSHDLRAPLRSMAGFSEVLLEDHGEDLDEAGRDAARRVRAASRRMAVMIDDLLRLSRVSRQELSRERVDLSGMARRIARELQQQEPERSAHFRIAEGLRARADPRLAELALRNLLDNAWKYSDREEEATIEIGRREDDGREVVFYVEDNGVGFDPRYSDKLFTAFQRLHRIEEFPGTGIGLAIVHRIVTRHGGRIWAESRPGEGAAFYFTLEPADKGGGREG